MAGRTVDNTYSTGPRFAEKTKGVQPSYVPKGFYAWKKRWCEILSCGLDTQQCGSIEKWCTGPATTKVPHAYAFRGPPGASSPRTLPPKAAKPVAKEKRKRERASRPIKQQVVQNYTVEFKKVAATRRRALVAFEQGLRTGRLWMIERALEDHGQNDLANLPLPNTEGMTPLMILAESVWKAEDYPSDLVETLIVRYGADVNATDNRGLTALMHALCHGSILLAEDFVRFGCRITDHGVHGESALTFAVASDDVHTCQWALYNLQQAEGKTEAAVLNEQDKLGYTPLCHAAQGGELRAARWLCRRGADIFAGASNGGDHPISPCALAALEGRVEVLALLLRKGGCLIEDVKLHEDTLKWVAGFSWQFPGSCGLTQTGGGPIRSELQQFHEALRDGSVKNIVEAAQAVHLDDSIARAAGMDKLACVVNARDMSGQSALHLAMAAKHAKAGTCDGLLHQIVNDGKADVHATDDSGCTALMLVAEARGKASIAGMTALLGLNKDENSAVTMEDAEARRVTMHCFSGGDQLLALKKLQIVLEASSKAELEWVDCYGWSVMEFAISHGYVDVIKWLLASLSEAPIDPANASDALDVALTRRTLQGATPLLLAARTGSVETCSVLLNAKADPLTADDQERMFCDYAQEAPSSAGRAAVEKWWHQITNQEPSAAVPLLSDSSGTSAKSASNGIKSKLNAFIRVATGILTPKQHSSVDTKVIARVATPAKQDCRADVQSYISGKSSVGGVTPTISVATVGQVKATMSCTTTPSGVKRFMSSASMVSTVSHRHHMTRKHTMATQMGRSPTSRWTCFTCGRVCMDDRKSCSFCGDSPEVDSARQTGHGERRRKRRMKKGDESVQIVDDDGLVVSFTVESIENSEHKVLRCYHDGQLESRVMRLRLIWDYSMVEDFGYEYSGGVETKQRTMGSIEVPSDKRKIIFKRLLTLAEHARAKCIVVGGPLSKGSPK